MKKKKSTGSMKILMSLAVVACIAVMVLSAAAASEMFIPSKDNFSSSLGRNLAALCEASDCGLSRTQLGMIENAEIKSIRYDTDSDGNKIFIARLLLRAPVCHAGIYSENPREYLKTTYDSMFAGEAEEIEIMGLCGSDESADAPVVDVETLNSIVSAAEKAWNKEQLTTDINFEYALTDMIIPEPYADRVFSEGAEFQSTYSDWLDVCAAEFASEGLTVASDDGISSQVSDIRSAMEQVVTPFLCSVRNVTLSKNNNKNGYYTLSFDTLDVIGTLSTAKKPSVSALNKLAGAYSDERAMKISIDIDVADILTDESRMKLSFFNIIRAVTGYGSTVIKPLTKITAPSSTQVISGKSNGQWPLEFKRAKGDGNVIINIISIDDAGEESSVLKIFLKDGGKITVCLSKGRYRLNMAVGTTYYGSRELFGANGIYMRDTQNIYTVPSNGLKTVTVEKQPGESLGLRDYLLSVYDDPSLIHRTEF